MLYIKFAIGKFSFFNLSVMFDDKKIKKGLQIKKCETYKLN